jgi:glycosyltransferase involved in cell wall biosynthesis
MGLDKAVGLGETVGGDGIGKVALVHDDLVQAGGAERVVVALHDIFPHAPVFTSLYVPKATFDAFRGMDIRTSFLQKTPFASRRLHKLALPYFPAAFEGFDLSGFDLVLSNTTRFAKGVITPPETCHVCYCHTPPRFAWRPQDYFAQNSTARTLAPLMRGMMTDLRIWDLAASQRVDFFVAGSQNAARRIRKYYRRDSAAVIYPPVETARYAPVGPGQVGRHFLAVSRLVGYKRIDLAIAACNLLGAELRIVGTGPEMAVLRRKAGPTIRFLGRLPDAEVADEYARCRAFVFPGEEDFGLTPLEAMASGRPVVAYGAGGALETVVAGRTGLFFGEQTAESLAGALKQLDSQSFVPQELRSHAEGFDIHVFRDQMSRFAEWAVEEHRLQIGAGQIGERPEQRQVRVPYPPPPSVARR